ncbi:MAG: flagella basal body P-ring formation protein FlgA [Candidatus Sulfotelmatobacter sp.]
MRRIGILSGLMVLAFSYLPAAAAPVPCTGIGIRAAAEVGDSGVSLADLLTAESCAAVRHAAASVWLGDSPRPGSSRVFEGSEIRRALEQLALAAPIGETVADARPAEHAVPEHMVPASIVPERIVVRRAGARASCAEITDFISRSLRTRMPIDAFQAAGYKPAGFQNLPRELDCGRASRVPPGAPLELTRVFWDPALRGWEYSLRCVHAGDCVPFLVRQILAAANSARTSPPGSDVRLQKDKPQPANAPLAVQVGQTATLFWEQDGIRAVLPVTCLDRGSVGSLVRARTKNGNRILRAEVVSAGVLRAAL